ncbi:MAG: glutathione S-transferase family protein [Rhodospirillaceae bacterium]|jgi:glutathione S-transferase|nr:glutathione S-transferase family protein [Rhodospirillaceae bacterium]
MYKLYWSPGSANMTPHAILEEIGVPYELIKIDTSKGEQRNPDYLKVNPHARVPTLVYDGGKLMYEAAAISLFLIERHPGTGLAPEPGHADRAPFLQWLAYLTNTVQEACMHWWHPENFVAGEDHQAAVKRTTEARLAKMFGLIDAHLAQSGPYLCGNTFYACDYYCAMLARWTRAMTAPAHTHPRVRDLVRAAMARPAYARMLEMEGIAQPS